MQDSWNGEDKKIRKPASNKTRRFDADDLKGKPLPKQKRKARLSWKIQKYQLEQMDINDLKNYITETEY
jgi:hypothetical protein